MANVLKKGSSGPDTNIDPDMIKEFDALRNPGYQNFALFSCFYNGHPTAAIVAVERSGAGPDGEEFKVTPLYVRYDPKYMTLTDHDGVVPAAFHGRPN